MSRDAIVIKEEEKVALQYLFTKKTKALELIENPPNFSNQSLLEPYMNAAVALKLEVDIELQTWWDVAYATYGLDSSKKYSVKFNTNELYPDEPKVTGN